MRISSDEYTEGDNSELNYPIKFEPISLLVYQIDKFRNISNTQWEQSGYDSPEDSTFDNVKDFLCTLPEKYLFNLSPENIEPTPYGTLVLDFTNNEKVVSIEIGKSKIGYYTKNIDLKPNPEGINLDAENIPNEILDAFEKMFS